MLSGGIEERGDENGKQTNTENENEGRIIEEDGY